MLMQRMMIERMEKTRLTRPYPATSSFLNFGRGWGRKTRHCHVKWSRGSQAPFVSHITSISYFNARTSSMSNVRVPCPSTVSLLCISLVGWLPSRVSQHVLQHSVHQFLRVLRHSLYPADPDMQWVWTDHCHPHPLLDLEQKLRAIQDRPDARVGIHGPKLRSCGEG
jgi:hypothetical protein